VVFTVASMSMIDRFAEPVGALLDLSATAARELLDQLHDESLWTSDVPPPARAFWVRGGPRVEGCVRGFVRIPHGASFPDHEHLGEERGFALQGAFVDPATGERFRAGDSFAMPAGSRHQPYVSPDGLDLLFLVVVAGGYRVGEDLLLSRD
jgi:ChrR Cupin-like domain